MSIISPIALYHLSVVLLCFFTSCSKIVYQSNQQAGDNTENPQSTLVDTCLVCFDEIFIDERLVFCPKVEAHTTNKHLVCIGCIAHLCISEHIEYTCPVCRTAMKKIDVVAAVIPSIKQDLKIVQFIEQYLHMIIDNLKKVNDLKGFEKPLNELLNVGNMLLKHGYIDIFKGFITLFKEANQSKIHYFQNSLLHIAAKRGYKQVLEQLIKLFPIYLDINSVNHNYRTPLYYAISRGYLEIVEQLLASDKIDLTCYNHKHDQMLHFAINNGYLTSAKLLIQSEKIDLQATDRHGKTPLYCAVRSRQLEIVKLLLASERIDLAAVSGCGGEYLLDVAINNGDLAMVKLLIESQQIHLDVMASYNVLNLAIVENNLQIARFLIQSGAIDIHRKDAYGRTLLYYADAKTHGLIINLLTPC